MFTCNVVDVLRRSVHVLVGILSIVDLGMFPFQILSSFHKIGLTFLYVCVHTYVYIHTCVYICYVYYLYMHTAYTMKHVSFFGPHDHLIQQILVSGRQWSVPSSSIVVSPHDLYILCVLCCT